MRSENRFGLGKSRGDGGWLRRRRTGGAAKADRAAMIERMMPLEPRLLMATFSVTNLSDAGAGSLRQALSDAAVLAGTDTISFDASLSGTITLSTGLSINSAVNLFGPGARYVTISGAGVVRPFNVTASGSVIAGLTVANGNAGTGTGGGINVASGVSLGIDSVLFQNNTAKGGGGLAVAAGAVVGVQYSTFRQDTDTSTGSTGGGAIYNFNGMVTIANATFVQNSSTFGGGAIFTSGTTPITNITNATIANNADTGGGTAGGVYSLSFSGSATTYKNSIISANTSTNNPGSADVYGANTDGGGNLVGGSPNLGPIAWLGGNTPTLPLLPGSPAIDAGTASGAPTTDQRGVSRVGAADIGAFEYDHKYYAVTSTADSGAGTLRQAITDADAAALVGGNHVIYFGFSGTAVNTIQPSSGLPDITRAVLVDGYSQIGSSANTATASDNAAIKVYLDGKGTSTASGLHLLSAGNTVRGLAIGGFNGQLGIAGVRAESSSNLVAGNFLGLSPSGVANANDLGFLALTTGTGNTLGGTTLAARNVLSGNARHGAELFTGTSANVVAGNFIGINLAGTGALPNANLGISVFSPNNTIGGTAAGAGNVVSGNTLSGIALNTSATTGTLVIGNKIGTDATGLAPVANGGYGVAISGASSSTIGGTLASARNIISGNADDGIHAAGTTASSNLILGNYIGLDATGKSLATGAVALYRADGTMLDEINGQNGSTVSGAGVSYNATGEVGQAFQFDGSSNTRITLNNSASGPLNITGQALTVEAWVNQSNATQSLNGSSLQVIFDKAYSTTDDGYGLYLVAGKLQGYISTPSAIIYLTAPTAVSVGTWTHVGMTYDGSTLRLYVNGVQVTSAAITGSIRSNPNNAAIGGDQSPSAIYGFKGSIDELAVYNRTLDITELAAIVSSGTSGKPHLLGNKGDGIEVDTALANTIGGTAAGAGNVIGGNAQTALYLHSDGTARNFATAIQGNKLGTDPTGLIPEFDGYGNVTLFDGANGVTIGGSVAGAG